jgi:DNA-binding transcriptional regulator YhcF (GntR family)
MNITALERPASLVERVCQQLAELIRGGSSEEERWLPGERSLAEKLGVSRTVVREATKRLEQQGMLEIQHGTGIKIVDRLHRPLNDSLSLLIPDMADRLQQLNETRLSIEPDAAAEKIGESRERILKALSYLEEAGDIEIKPSGLRHKFRLLAGAKERNPREIATWLHGLFTSREKQDMARLDGIVEFASAPGCSVRRLLAYFGEKMDSDCGSCGRCRGEKAMPLPKGMDADISHSDAEMIKNLRAEGHAALRAKRQLARFLCGISSPAVTRDRLTRHDAFGRLESVPFSKVLEYLDVCL